MKIYLVSDLNPENLFKYEVVEEFIHRKIIDISESRSLLCGGKNSEHTNEIRQISIFSKVAFSDLLHKPVIKNKKIENVLKVISINRPPDSERRETFEALIPFRQAKDSEGVFFLMPLDGTELSPRLLPVYRG